MRKAGIMVQMGDRLALASDHAGFRFKERVKAELLSMGYEVDDFGAFSDEAVDYPLYIRPAAEAVASGKCMAGVIFGGSGNGEAMVANKVRGIRCAVCWNVPSARLAKAHNDANIISIGERMMDPDTALDIVRVWLGTAFEGGRHARRIAQIEA